jgi:hypothetical protein
MKRCGFLAVFAVALLILTPVAFGQSATCTAVTPANTAFNAALLGNGFSGTSGSPTGFANVNFAINGNQGTVNASSLGLSNITGVSLFQGQPGTSGAMLIQTFTGTFANGRFTSSATLSPALISQIQANPGNYFFVVTTPDFPNGALAGSLAPTRQQLVTGVLSAPLINNAGTVLFSIGPENGTSTVTLNFDVNSPSLANGTINSLQLIPPSGSGSALVFGNNLVATNGRITGSIPISSALAQQILANPCSFSFAINSSAFSGGSATGTLAASNEVFLPVVGSVTGLNGTNFKTDINVYNSTPFTGTNAPLGTSANTFLQFYPAGVTNSTSAIAAKNVSTLSVPVRGTTTVRDISASMFGGAINGIGALRILSAGNIAANARIYNDQSANGKGTFGQFEPGMNRSQALQQGVLVGVGNVATDLTLANGQSFRTNVGFFNANDTATTIDVELRDSSGTVRGSQMFTLGPWTLTQLPLVGGGGLFSNITGDIATSSVYFLSGNPIFAYASEIDNVSGDASFITPSADFQSPGSTTGQ